MSTLHECLDRRHVLREICGCAYGTVFHSSSPSPATAQKIYAVGCRLSAEGARAYQQQGKFYELSDDPFRISGTTGNPEMDRQLDKAVRIAADILEVRPAFGFIEPDKFVPSKMNSMNAYALNHNVGTSRGAVLFGMGKFRAELYGHDESGTTVMSIVAHEFGHIIQYNLAYYTQLNQLQCENNADFLAGYYLGVRARAIPTLRFDKAVDLFDRIGRSGNGDPNRDHGDSRERVEAVRAGFASAHFPLQDAIRVGLQFVGHRS
jgi:hypothetical protein